MQKLKLREEKEIVQSCTTRDRTGAHTSGPLSPDNIRSCTALTVSSENVEEGELAEGSKVREDLQREMVHN